MNMLDHKKNILELIAELERQGFSKTVDSNNDYSTEADLYYRYIGDNRYIVFNHYNKNSKYDLQGFDCRISTYNSENEIGKKEAIQIEGVLRSFQVKRDWNLIAGLLISSDEL
ncbi:MAG TPA: hypothetical protein PLZ12_15985 [Saprospiraceae bacterium]|nr:hypothetical protein [Saprospiraceae bacterium]